MKIPYACPNINNDDKKAVSKVLHSKQLTQGKIVKQFEDAICEYTGAKYAIACNSATTGLFLAYGFIDKTKISMPANTFRATANAAINTAKKIAFQDCLPAGHTYTCTEDKDTIYVIVDYAGSAYLEKLKNYIVIRDAAHSLGSSFSNGKKVGSCEGSAITIFSTHAIKNITTGEGGIVTTNNIDVYKLIKTCINHGRGLDIDTGVGLNYKMTEFQAALGLSQLKRIDDFKARKDILYDTYINKLCDYPTILSQRDNSLTHWHLFVIHLRTKNERNVLHAFLMDKNIETQIHYQPVHTLPYFKKHGYDQESCPNAIKHWETSLSLPFYSGMTDEEQAYVIDSIDEFYNLDINWDIL